MHHWSDMNVMDLTNGSQHVDYTHGKMKPTKKESKEATYINCLKILIHWVFITFYYLVCIYIYHVYSLTHASTSINVGYPYTLKTAMFLLSCFVVNSCQWLSYYGQHYLNWSLKTERTERAENVIWSKAYHCIYLTILTNSFLFYFWPQAN